MATFTNPAIQEAEDIEEKIEAFLTSPREGCEDRDYISLYDDVDDYGCCSPELILARKDGKFMLYQTPILWDYKLSSFPSKPWGYSLEVEGWTAKQIVEEARGVVGYCAFREEEATS